MDKLIELYIEKKSYEHKGSEITIFRELTLSLERGKFVAIIGPSGCGKSTLLRILAGLDRTYSGQLRTDGSKPRMSFVFQELALLPWLTVEGNLRFVSDDPALIERRLNEVGLLPYRKFRIKALSGGMKQRVAVARGLINEPELLLLDEPLRELDMITKEKLQGDLRGLLRKGGVTTVMVSHDIEECIFLADTIIVLSDKPALIRKTFQVDFDPQDRSSAEFQELKRQIRNELF